MAYLAGSPITLSLTLKDSGGAIIPSATLLFPHTRGTAGAAFVPTWAYTGTNGVYTVTIPATALQVWGYAELWVRSIPAPAQDFYATLPVVTGSEPYDTYVTRPVVVLMVVLDSNANGVANALFQVESARRPDGSSFASGVTFTKRADGAYVATFTPTIIGTYYLRVSTTNVTPQRVFEGTFDANAIPAAAVSGRRPVLLRTRLDTPGQSKTLIRGDTAEWSWSIVDQSGAPFDLTGCTVWFTAKRSSDDADVDAIIKHYWVSGGSSSGLSSTSPTAGLMSQVIPATVTDTYDPRVFRTLNWDAQIKYDSVKIKTMESDQLTITDDITRRVITP